MGKSSTINERISMIIAFVGRAGSGKDYQCKLLEKQGYTRFAFAEQIRKIIAERSDEKTQ